VSLVLSCTWQQITSVDFFDSYMSANPPLEAELASLETKIERYEAVLTEDPNDEHIRHGLCALKAREMTLRADMKRSAAAETHLEHKIASFRSLCERLPYEHNRVCVFSLQL